MEATSSGGGKTLMCRFCKVLPEKLIIEGGPDRILCPSCGREDNFDVAVRIAGEHANYEILQEHQNRMKRLFRGSQSTRYIPGRLPRRQRPRVFVYL